jgi:hypothetical protein
LVYWGFIYWDIEEGSLDKVIIIHSSMYWIVN